MNNYSIFLSLSEDFIGNYLSNGKGLSLNTIKSYKYAFRLLIEFMYKQKGIDANKIQFSNLDYNTLLSFFDWIVDHPCEHVKILEAPIHDFNVICLDRDHVSFIKKYLTNIKSVHMIPLGGYLSEPYDQCNTTEFKRRKYDLIFTGSYVPMSRFEESILSLPDRMKKMTIMIMK